MTQPSKDPFIDSKSVALDDNFYKYAHMEDLSAASQIQSNDVDPTFTSTSTSTSRPQYLSSDYQPQPHNYGYGHHQNAFGNSLGPLISNQSNVSYDQEPVHTPSSKKYKRGSRIFLSTSIISAFLVLALEVYMYAVINIHKDTLVDSKYLEISIFLSLFIFATVYQVVLTVVGLKIKSMLLLFLLCIFYCCMLVYTGIQYQEVSKYFSVGLKGHWKTATRATNIATIAVLAITLVVQIYVIFFVMRKEVSWFQYKKIGADLRIRRMFNFFQVHRCFLIFDFFFFVGFTIQFLVIMVKKTNSVEFILTVIVLPLTLVVLFLSDLATTREIVLLSIATIVLFLCGAAYVIFKIIRLFTKYTSAYRIAMKPGAYFPGRTSLVTFGAITLVLLILTVIVEIIIVYNYNKGLLPVVSTYWGFLPGASQRYEKKFNAGHSDINLIPQRRGSDGSMAAALESSSIID